MKNTPKTIQEWFDAVIANPPTSNPLILHELCWNAALASVQPQLDAADIDKLAEAVKYHERHQKSETRNEMITALAAYTAARKSTKEGA